VFACSCVDGSEVDDTVAIADLKDRVFARTRTACLTRWEVRCGIALITHEAYTRKVVVAAALAWRLLFGKRITREKRC
jgi:hypothetical protein